MKNVKLKDYQYQIKGIDSSKPLNQCLEAIGIGLAFPLVVAIVVRFVNYIITGS